MTLGKSGYSSDDSQRTIRASNRRTPSTAISKSAKNERIPLTTARADIPAPTLVSHVNAQGTIHGAVELEECHRKANSVGVLQQIGRPSESVMKTPSSTEAERPPLDGVHPLSPKLESQSFFERLRQNRVFDVPAIPKIPEVSTTHLQERTSAPAPTSSDLRERQVSRSSTSSTASGREMRPGILRSAQSAKPSGTTEKQAAPQPDASSRVKAPLFSASNSLKQAPSQGVGLPVVRGMPTISQMSRSETVRPQSRPQQIARATSDDENHASRPASSDAASKKGNRLVDHQNTLFTGVPGIPQMQATVQSRQMSNRRLIILPEQKYSIRWDAEEGFVFVRGILRLYDSLMNEGSRHDEPYSCVTSIQFRSFVPATIRSVESEYNPEFFITYHSSKVTPNDDPMAKITTMPWMKLSDGWYKPFDVPLPVNMFLNRESRVFIAKAQVTFKSNRIVFLTSRTTPFVVELLHGSREMVFHSPTPKIGQN